MEFKSPKRDLLDHSFFLFLCLGLLVLTTIKWVPWFFDIKWLSVLPGSCLPCKHLKEICGHFLIFQMLNVSRLSKVAGRFVSTYNSEKREQIPGEKNGTNQSLTLAFNPFLFLYLLPKMRSCMQWGRFITGRFSSHCLFSAQYLSINGFNNFSKIWIGILHVSQQCFLSISEWLSNLPNDCDHYIQAFTLTQM